MAKVPNLFIVGAPKSGTTALWSYLGSHPDIFMGGKEYHFFGSDLVYKTRAHMSADTYLGCFSRATDERYRGEASIGYLCSTRAAQEIHDFSPDSRIVAILRNPVDMIHSLHSEMLFQGDEDIVDFEEALAAEDDRKRGERIPPMCQFQLWSLFYRDVGRYAEQVERYFDVFGRDQVHVIIFDDFKADVAASYLQTLRFLEIDPDFRPEFPVVNANKVARSATAVRLLRRPPQTVRRLARAVIPSQSARRSLGRRLQTLNAQNRSRDAIAPALRRSLQLEFADDVVRLGKLLDRDLSGWTAPS